MWAGGPLPFNISLKTKIIEDDDTLLGRLAATVLQRDIHQQQHYNELHGYYNLFSTSLRSDCELELAIKGCSK